MAINISAWSIRHPMPPIVMAAAIVAARLHQFHQAADHAHAERGCSVDHRRDHAVRRVARRARNRRLPRRSRTPLRALRAPTTSLRRSRMEFRPRSIIFRLGTDTDRALNDVKDAVTRIRGDLPRSINEPMVQRIDITGLPILTYAAIAPGKTPEQLSLFVEDVVDPRAARNPRRRQPSSASAASSARFGWDSIRCGCRGSD